MASTSVACPSASSCVTAGSYSDSSGDIQAVLVTGSGTSWTAAEAPLPANAAADRYAFLGSVACPSASSCVAAGVYADSSGNGPGAAGYRVGYVVDGGRGAAAGERRR